MACESGWLSGCDGAAAAAEILQEAREDAEARRAEAAERLAEAEGATATSRVAHKFAAMMHDVAEKTHRRFDDTARQVGRSGQWPAPPSFAVCCCGLAMSACLPSC
eukprot:scaffold1531_cov296-Prasinococcus_capsulatus_cf.AAC.16